MSNTKTYWHGRETNFGWLVRHVTYASDDCLTWPFGGCNGYGNLRYEDRIDYAHRVMCELVNGPCPSPLHEAAHSCGRGHFKCVHPKHLSWKTKTENQLDRAKHGTKATGPHGKLTQKQADEIRALKDILTQKEIAAHYNTSRSNVSFIHCGKAWTGKPTKYSKAREMRECA